MDFILDDSDLEFYRSLPKEEKFLFLYDLFCTDSYDELSADYDDTALPIVTEQSKIKSLTYFSEEELAAFETKISSLVESSIQDDVNVNVTILNDIIVFNANDYDSIKETVLAFFMSGLILTELELKDSLLRMFQKKRICQAYFLIGRERKIQGN